jgi:hypothetical protein
LAVEECVTPGGIASAMHPHASADFADWRMTHRSLGACAPKRFSAQGRRWVGLLETTGLPVGLHSKGDLNQWGIAIRIIRMFLRLDKVPIIHSFTSDESLFSKTIEIRFADDDVVNHLNA